MNKVLLISFRKTYSIFSLSRHAILEVTSSIQSHTLLGYLSNKDKNFDINGLELFYIWPDEIIDMAEIEEYISNYSPDILAVSLLHVDFGAYLRLRKRIDRLLGKKIIWIAGGYLPTSQPKETFIQGKFDYLIRSHGEIPFEQLLDELLKEKPNLSSVDNLITLNNNRLVSNQPKVFPNIEKNVRLSYSPFNVKYYTKESWQIPPISEMKYLTTWFSRGCPHNCGFCLNKEMNLGKVYVRNPDLVIDEIIEMRDRYGINYLFFADENFLVNEAAVINLLNKMIERNIKKDVRFTFMTDVKSIAEGNSELLDLLREAGCEEIQFGVESGSELLLSKMQKKNTISNCIKAFEDTSKKGIMTQAMMVLGYEGESLETLEETKKLIRTICPDRISYFYAIAFPKTDLFQKYYNKVKNLPLFFFDSDFPIFPVQSLERDLQKNNIRPEYYLDPGILRVFEKYDFSFSASQIYLLSFREDIMYDYYISNEFFDKQKDVFYRRSKLYKEDANKLLKGAAEWFHVLERSIESKNYAKTMMAVLKEGYNG